MTRPPDTSPRPDDDALEVIRRNLDWLHHWLPAAVGPLIAEPAARIVTETIEACRDAIRDRDTTTDLLLDATKGD